MIIDKDHGFARIIGNIKNAAKQAYVSIGIHQEQGSKAHGEFTVAQIAAVHEYGSPENNIPQRSFIRDTHDLNLRANLKRLKRMQEQVLMGKLTQHEALTFLGEVASKQMTSRINQGIAPALKPATIKHKGSSTPLIDTGQLKGSIGFEVHL
ncbi:MAG: hypothetical protein WCK49_11125 [Myxococcaceae bacterium]